MISTSMDIAANYLSWGLSVLPARRLEKRPALQGKWEPFKNRLPTPSEVQAWFSNNQEGLCIICGAVSGNLEMLDFDFAGELYQPWCQLIQQTSPGLLAKLVVETTPAGGWHTSYRCASEVSGSLKLAQRKRPVKPEEITLNQSGQEVIILHGKPYNVRTDADGQKYVLITLIETRGEGGLFLCDPTPGYQLQQGGYDKIPVLTADERDILLQAAWELNEYLPPTIDGPAPDISNTSSSHATGLRPGDDYNQRGDVRGLLRQHGWTLTKPGENEYWCRPGKSSGTSATLKDRVFYVFTVNAPPFEANRGYSPFSVYTLLEHQGNYENAARVLRQLGFGGDEAPLNLSELMEKMPGPPSVTEAEISDPGPIPESLFQVPGFIRQVMDFTLKNAPYPNIGLAFCGAIALQSYLCGRKVCTPGDLRPNIFLLALANSGTGKDFPRKVNARVLFEIGQVMALGDKFASGEGIQDALARTPAMLFQNDEMDSVLRQINLDRESRHDSIPSILMTVYTSASDVYALRAKANQKEAGHIDQPHLTLFGTATPQFFYESLSQRMLTNGFFARLIIIDIGNRGEGQKPGSVRDLPESILQIARWWANFQPNGVSQNLAQLHPKPKIVPYTAAADKADRTLQKQADQQYNLANNRNDEMSRVAWSRTYENASKLALIYACSENPEAPVISGPALEWATELAMHQTKRQLYLAQNYVAENPFHATCLKAVRKIKEAPNYQLFHSVLLKRMKMKTRDFKDLIETMLQHGDIQMTTITTAGRSGLAYKLVEGVKEGERR